MTHEDVQAWLDRYVEAWSSYDEAAIVQLFTDTATSSIARSAERRLPFISTPN